MRRVAVIAGVLLLGGLVASCGTDPQVRALEAESMASWLPEGGQEARRIVSEPGTTLGKPQYARVLRVIDVGSERRVRGALTGARAAAVDDGWEVAYEHDDGAFRVEREVEVGGERLRLTCAAGRQAIPSTDPTKEIYVSLEARPA